MEQNEEIILEQQVPAGKVYGERAAWTGVFLGGPIVAGYFIAENYKLFEQPEKAKRTWIISTIATVIIFGALFFAPNAEKLPRYIVPIIFAGITYWIIQYYQGNDIKAHVQAGGGVYSRWRAALVGLIGAIVTLVVLLGVVYAVGTNDIPNGTTKTYGTIKNQITYEKSIPETEIDKLAAALTQVTFFDESVAKEVYVKKIGDAYQISISCNASAKGNNEALKYFTQVKTDLQKLYPKNKIVIFLVVDSLDNIIQKIE